MPKHNAKNNLSFLPDLLLTWYDSAKRDLPWRNAPGPYEVWVSEIMLQQTRVETVKEYYKRFLAALPTVAHLAAADEELLMKLWQGLGYYSRVRNMAKAARTVAEQYGGHFPDTFETLRALSGIGDYTAGAVLSIAFGKPEPAVDGNVVRVLARITGQGSDDPACRADFKARLKEIYPRSRCGDFTQSLMELGATVCLPNGAPLCEKCPVAEFCTARREGRIADLPEKKAKSARKIVEMTVLIFEDSTGRIALKKRPAGGLLGGLWELPHIDSRKTAAVLQTELAVYSPDSIKKERAQKHIFSHIEWHMQPYRVRFCGSPAPGWQMVSADDLQNAYPLPVAFSKLLKK